LVTGNGSKDVISELLSGLQVAHVTITLYLTVNYCQQSPHHYWQHRINTALISRFLTHEKPYHSYLFMIPNLEQLAIYTIILR
jgi:hypothetical protein